MRIYDNNQQQKIIRMYQKKVNCYNSVRTVTTIINKKIIKMYQKRSGSLQFFARSYDTVESEGPASHWAGNFSSFFLYFIIIIVIVMVIIIIIIAPIGQVIFLRSLLSFFPSSSSSLSSLA